MLNIGDKIKAARKSANITQKELANMIGVTTTTIQNYENNRREPNFNTLECISKALNLSINELLGVQNDFTFADSLNDIRFNSVMSWISDKSFNIVETTIMKEHFNDLLLKYKNLIEELSNLKYRWEIEQEAYKNLYKNKENPLSDESIKVLFIRQELEHSIENISAWINAFPDYIVHRELELNNKNNNK
ncbi:helix-turn-helix domain-containing protein [Clostridium culturomicium]|uniref:helix-turn-helix domain-containing protein n=1 Tax=Clostridium culturomicium TaxID=1499683 RepID=UPI0038577647